MPMRQGKILRRQAGLTPTEELQRPLYRARNYPRVATVVLEYGWWWPGSSSTFSSSVKRSNTETMYTESYYRRKRQRNLHPPVVNRFWTAHKDFPWPDGIGYVETALQVNGQHDWVRGHIGRYIALNHPVVSTPVFDLMVEARAQQNCWSDAANPSFPLGTFLGELTKTLHSIRNPAMALRTLKETILQTAKRRRKIALVFENDLFQWRTYYRSAKRVKDPFLRRDWLRELKASKPQPPAELRGKPAAWVEINRAIKNTWLEYRYSATPTILDAKAIAKTIAELGLGARFSVFRGYARSTTAWRKVSTGNVLIGNVRIYYDVLEREVNSSSAGFYARPRMSESIAIHAQRWGMSISNMPAVAWELTTLSFVVDWFLGMGKFLGAMFPPYGFEFQTGWTSEVAVIQRRITNYRVGSGYAVSKMHVEDYLYEHRLQRRTPGVPENPGFPLIHFGLTWQRAIDAFALLK